jgi:acetolactate synthase I/II/III large subunit
MPLIAQADCVLLLGYDPIEMRIGWRNPFGPWIRPSSTSPPRGADHGMHRADIPLIGGIAPTLHALATTRPARWPAGRTGHRPDAR